MTGRPQTGFTIIELLFFVAISGLLTISLLAGWTVMVNAQSYKDSARSLVIAIQDEYDSVYNVTADRDATYGCGQQGQQVNVSNSQTKNAKNSRGTTDCVIMGRYLELNGTSMTSRPILGIEPAVPSLTITTDKAAILEYLPTRLQDDNESIPTGTFDVPWGASPYFKTDKSQAVHLSIVIIRSPTTGTIYTYHQSLNESQQLPGAQDVIQNGTQSELTLCLDPAAVVGQGVLAVRISANANSSESVSVVGDATNGCSI